MFLSLGNVNRTAVYPILSVFGILFGAFFLKNPSVAEQTAQAFAIAANDRVAVFGYVFYYLIQLV